jgi:hypothetical protein
VPPADSTHFVIRPVPPANGIVAALVGSLLARTISESGAAGADYQCQRFGGPYLLDPRCRFVP